ncbi:CLUMA_CG006383, isoform A [Clunio marinus]|uniref:CLUMA_CG006383, isoform A n=1 Tax=Clunio marinus TaxID=568069 RepID=A0A1J1HXV1_9DIPT|nr:CLUMA_CG006383, isoform A [Clunio marinus]
MWVALIHKPSHSLLTGTDNNNNKNDSEKIFEGEKFIIISLQISVTNVCRERNHDEFLSLTDNSDYFFNTICDFG